MYITMDKKEISIILTEKLGKKVTVIEILLIDSGHHSEGYKIVTQEGNSYFVKKIKSYDIGFEFPERKISSYLVSHSMLKRADIAPKTIGVVIKNTGMEFLPEIKESTEIYHFQEYAGEGRKYIDMLDDKVHKKRIDDSDKREIDLIIDFIVKIHKIKHHSKDKEQLKSIYNDCLRNVIGNPEYLLMLLHSIPDNNPILCPQNQGEFMALMLENMHFFKDRSERLVALHGDFWGANVFFRKDGSFFVIDYSRMPWGDAGFDIGFWMSQYLLKYHQGNKIYFKELGNYFLNEYIRKTKDKEITQTMVYSLGLIAAMYASPIWVSGIEEKVRISFFNHICGMLKKKDFYW